ncbi:MAG: hypothetical protein N2321_07995 [Melioribacteraceae bacterium]|nr:hypothetical protein [Melioribacteraceae bacterium]
MSILWITEAIQLFVTSLLQLIVFPLANVLAAKDISQGYMNSAIFFSWVNL